MPGEVVLLYFDNTGHWSEVFLSMNVEALSHAVTGLHNCQQFCHCILRHIQSAAEIQAGVSLLGSPVMKTRVVEMLFTFTITHAVTKSWRWKSLDIFKGSRKASRKFLSQKLFQDSEGRLILLNWHFNQYFLSYFLTGQLCYLYNSCQVWIYAFHLCGERSLRMESWPRIPL